MRWRSFAQQASELSVPLTQEQIDRFRRYTDLLLNANRRINLTALRDEASLMTKFYLDALGLLPVIARYAGLSPDQLRIQPWCAADVGSGGGAPAIPLAIAWPDLRYTLIESIAKKARFLDETAASLGLNMTVVIDRAENASRSSKHRERYDLVTARAVAALATLVELTLPLARVGSLIVLPKGPKAQEEADDAAAIELLGGELAGIEQLAIPGVDETRMAVVIRKIAPTPDRYPRRPGLPSKKPL
jgi:16S rRNA (guanine527-N7)-methyltransferase